MSKVDKANRIVVNLYKKLLNEFPRKNCIATILLPIKDLEQALEES